MTSIEQDLSHPVERALHAAADQLVKVERPRRSAAKRHEDATGDRAAIAVTLPLVLLVLRRMVRSAPQPRMAEAAATVWKGALSARRSAIAMALREVETVPLLSGVTELLGWSAQQLLPSISDDTLSAVVSCFDSTALSDEATGEAAGSARRFLGHAEVSGWLDLEETTSDALASLVAAVVQPRSQETVLDPNCRAGAYLVACARAAGGPVALRGQERSPVACAFAKLLLALENHWDARIECSDSLVTPACDDGELARADVVVGTAPFWLRVWESDDAEHDKFRRFAPPLPPRRRAEMASLLHMTATMAPGGRMAVATTLGMLSRVGVEGRIRRRWLDEDLVEAVIALPSGVLRNSAVPLALIVFNRRKVTGRTRQVLFVRGGALAPDFNTQEGSASRSKANPGPGLERIAEVFRNWKLAEDDRSFARVVKVNDLLQSAPDAESADLRVEHHVGSEGIADIDLAAAERELEKLEKKRAEAEREMDAAMRNLKNPGLAMVDDLD